MSLVIQLATADYDQSVKDISVLGARSALEWAAAEYGFDLEDAMRKADMTAERKATGKDKVVGNKPTKSGKDKADKKKSDKAPRAKSGYNLFLADADTKAQAKAAVETAKENDETLTTIKASANLWKALGDEGKKVWNDKAAGLKVSVAKDEPHTGAEAAASSDSANTSDNDDDTESLFLETN